MREYAENMLIEEVVEQAITECINEGILKKFLLKNRSEAKSVSIYEYDQEKHLKMEREEALEKGRKKGSKEGRKEGKEEKLNEQICKKLDKGKTIIQIADELEEKEPSDESYKSNPTRLL